MASNLDVLKDADIFDEGAGLTDEQKQQIEDLSQEEVQALIDIKKKLSKFTWPIQTVILPRML
ncbi:aroma-sacti cluster domain-containing protein [Mesorhizobium sp.]|uniref:aroma-sacti cluster domain-containing protein n=1 Tax=Mesorhizobium sp. TaxID=1871066 RepID=UPI000FE74300|nr:aroma-sacti cluster domain-containing protein [Mesorhizobium sp.]RWP65817.1 MAG: hypothetical protein EOR08_04340 [Mesorhizobium sp.]